MKETIWNKFKRCTIEWIIGYIGIMAIVLIGSFLFGFIATVVGYAPITGTQF